MSPEAPLWGVLEGRRTARTTSWLSSLVWRLGVEGVGRDRPDCFDREHAKDIRTAPVEKLQHLRVLNLFVTVSDCISVRSGLRTSRQLAPTSFAVLMNRDV